VTTSEERYVRKHMRVCMDIQFPCAVRPDTPPTHARKTRTCYLPAVSRLLRCYLFWQQYVYPVDF